MTVQQSRLPTPLAVTSTSVSAGTEPAGEGGQTKVNHVLDRLPVPREQVPGECGAVLVRDVLRVGADLTGEVGEKVGVIPGPHLEVRLLTDLDPGKQDVLRWDKLLVTVNDPGPASLKRCSSKDFQHVVFVPTTTAAFHDETCAVGMLLQE